LEEVLIGGVLVVEVSVQVKNEHMARALGRDRLVRKQKSPPSEGLAQGLERWELVMDEFTERCGVWVHHHCRVDGRIAGVVMA
tara:strand:- start:62 stop:310 length:249 start_codon:yes stop_codon:yes gene_type:complete